jgi:hypothetical protein
MLTAGAYRPAEVYDAGIADKPGIPAAYLQKMRASRPGLSTSTGGWPGLVWSSEFLNADIAPAATDRLAPWPP